MVGWDGTILGLASDEKWPRHKSVEPTESVRYQPWRLAAYALSIFSVLMLATAAAIYSEYQTERTSHFAVLEHDLEANRTTNDVVVTMMMALLTLPVALTLVA